MTTENNKPVEDLTFEEAQSELDQIVFRLESEENTLEDTLALFERGQALLQRCTDRLEQAELRVKKLSGGVIEDLESPS